ncbi:MAG: hypothetical protein ACRET9_05325, partial [Burkholderiales bacterium]
TFLSITIERMHRIILLLFLACCLPAQAEEVTICYNHGCAANATVTFNEQQLANVAALFRGFLNAAEEREAIAQAVGILARYAGEQSPVFRDKGRDNDGGVDGRMDSADHSINTTAYLRVLAKRGLLKLHRVQSRVVRGATKAHWAARIAEIRTHQEFVVDSWFFANGHPAVIFPLDEWLKGAKPDA